MKVVLVSEMGSELVIGNASTSISGVLVAVAIVSLGSAMVVVHWVLLFCRVLIACVIALITFLLIALLLFLRPACFGLFLVLVPVHIVIAAIIVGSGAVSYTHLTLPTNREV